MLDGFECVRGLGEDRVFQVEGHGRGRVHCCPREELPDDNVAHVFWIGPRIVLLGRLGLVVNEVPQRDQCPIRVLGEAEEHALALVQQVGAAIPQDAIIGLGIHLFKVWHGRFGIEIFPLVPKVFNLPLDRVNKFGSEEFLRIWR